MDINNGFNSALYGICENLRRTIEFIPEKAKGRVEEIRIRKNLPVCLTVSGKTLFVLRDGTVCDYLSGDVLKASGSDLKETFMLLCRNSVYAHTSELKNGYIRMRNGHRAGICGSFDENGNLREVTSINIRISHEIMGSADSIIKKYTGA